MSSNDTETMILAQEGYDGVLKSFVIERDGITLGEVAEVFTDFLVACGYEYVTGVSIDTDGGVSHVYEKEEL